MDDKTKIIVDDNLKKYIKAYNIKLSNEEYNRLSSDYRGLLQSTEFLKNTKEDKAKFKNEYSYYYERMLKLLYKTQMKQFSNINVTLENEKENFYIGSIENKNEIYSSMKNILSNLDYLLAYSTTIVNNAVESEDKIVIDYNDCALGGEDPNTLLENMSDYYSGKSLRNDYLTTKNPDTSMLEDGMEIMRNAEKLSASNKRIEMVENYAKDKGRFHLPTELAIGELQNKAATIYVLMREEHRSHNFLWRWFKGGESRDRLNQFKERYCRVFGVNKNRATNNMLALAQGDSLLQTNHNSFCSEVGARNMFGEIKQDLETYKEIINNKFTDDLDNAIDNNEVLDELDELNCEKSFVDDLDIDIDDEKEKDPFNIDNDNYDNSIDEEKINKEENERHKDWEDKLEEENKLPDLPF